jgi:tRNA(adenine34) deaminase
MEDLTIDQPFMLEALREARGAAEDQEVPVGAVVVRQGRVIARARNQVEILRDATAHAEMIALTQAMGFLRSKWLNGCVLYVTLEPCGMCAGALVLSRIDRLVFGAADPKAGACGSVLNLAGDQRLNHRLPVTGGVLAAECGALLSGFFAGKRARARQE